MKLVFAGTPDVALPALETLISSEHDVLAVITQPPARAGRGRELQPSPVHAVADKFGIKALYPDSIREIDAVLRELQPDAIPVVAYGQLIPETMLDIPAQGWINLHFSLLPEWRGAAPVQHCIWRGDAITGATTFLIDHGMDSGPILGHVTQLVDPKDTSGALLARLHLHSWRWPIGVGGHARLSLEPFEVEWRWHFDLDRVSIDGTLLLEQHDHFARFQ